MAIKMKNGDLINATVFKKRHYIQEKKKNTIRKIDITKIRRRNRRKKVTIVELDLEVLMFVCLCKIQGSLKNNVVYIYVTTDREILRQLNGHSSMVNVE